MAEDPRKKQKLSYSLDPYGGLIKGQTSVTFTMQSSKSIKLCNMSYFMESHISYPTIKKHLMNQLWANSLLKKACEDRDRPCPPSCCSVCLQARERVLVKFKAAVKWTDGINFWSSFKAFFQSHQSQQYQITSWGQRFKCNGVLPEWPLLLVPTWAWPLLSTIPHLCIFTLSG